jgi:hypothetical protein
VPHVPLAQRRRQGLALEQLPGEERPVAEAADVADGHHAGVLQLPADLRLLDEAPRHLRPVDVLLQQYLDGQVTAQVQVVAAQHRAHAAACDLALELVAVACQLRRRHGVRSRLDDVGALALGFLQGHGPHRAQARARRLDVTEAGGQAGVERIRRDGRDSDGAVGILCLVHGFLSAS